MSSNWYVHTLQHRQRESELQREVEAYRLSRQVRRSRKQSPSVLARLSLRFRSPKRPARQQVKRHVRPA